MDGVEGIKELPQIEDAIDEKVSPPIKSPHFSGFSFRVSFPGNKVCLKCPHPNTEAQKLKPGS